MIIIKPTASRLDPNNPYTTKLHFDGGAVRDFYVRGSIAWPEGDEEGFALMAGQDIQSKIVYLFEEFQFWTVEHWLEDDGTLHPRDDDPTKFHVGLIQFITDNFTKYKSCSYFWGSQHVDIWKRWGTAVYNNPMLPKQIELIEVPYVKEVGENLVAEYMNTEKIKGDQRFKLYEKVQEQDIQDNNGAHALRALIAGFEYVPWVKINNL